MTMNDNSLELVRYCCGCYLFQEPCDDYFFCIFLQFVFIHKYTLLIDQEAQTFRSKTYICHIERKLFNTALALAFNVENIVCTSRYVDHTFTHTYEPAMLFFPLSFDALDQAIPRALHGWKMCMHKIDAKSEMWPSNAQCALFERLRY